MALSSPSPTTPHPHALQKGEEKRSAAFSIGIDEAFIAQFVDEFYTAIRADELLGPIFLGRITDWPTHLEQMNRFWQSILLGTANFNGNPMLKHIAIPHLDETHFTRWLELFYATIRNITADEAAIKMVGGKARMIASGLLNAAYIHQRGTIGTPSHVELPHV